MNKHTIIIKWENNPYTHARITEQLNGFFVEFGKVRGTVFVSLSSDYLFYSKYPEITAVFDGTAWNLPELITLLNRLHAPDEEIKAELNRLLQDGLVEETNGGYTITQTGYASLLGLIGGTANEH